LDLQCRSSRTDRTSKPTSPLCGAGSPSIAAAIVLDYGYDTALYTLHVLAVDLANHAVNDAIREANERMPKGATKLRVVTAK